MLKLIGKEIFMILRSNIPVHALTRDFCTYLIHEQQRFRRACAYAVADAPGYTQSMEVGEGSDQKSNFRGQKFHSSARNYERYLERTGISSQSTRPVGRVLLQDECFYRTSALGRITRGSHITYFSRLKDKCMCLQDE